MRCLCFVLLLTIFLHGGVFAQSGKTTSEDRASEIARGSSTAKGGFENEDEIRDRFNNWKTDEDAQAWLKAMNYAMADVIAVKAAKPHGEKADVEVRVTTKNGEKTEAFRSSSSVIRMASIRSTSDGWLRMRRCGQCRTRS